MRPHCRAPGTRVGPQFEPLEDRCYLSVILTPVALQGRAAPGVEAEVIFGRPLNIFNDVFGTPIIDDAGRVYFSGTLASATLQQVANDGGIWVWSGGVTQLLARLGDVAPGTGETILGFASLNAAGDGRYAFTVSLTGELEQSAALISGLVGGASNVLVRAGDPAPGGTDFRYGLPGAPLLNAQGQVGHNTPVVSSVEGGSAGWINQTLVNLEGRPAEDVPSDDFLWSSGGILFLNDNGEVALANALRSPDLRGITGMWTGAPGSLTLDPVVGTPDLFFPERPVPQTTIAPGTANFEPGAPGVPFSTFVPSTFNNAGQVVINDVLMNLIRPSPPEAPLVRVAGVYGLFAGDPSNVQLVALEGRTVADPASGAVFGDPQDAHDPAAFTGFQGVVMNGAGQIAFRSEMRGAGVTPANAGGIWFGLPGQLELLARTGDAAPGVPNAPNATFTALSGPHAINNLGQVVFGADIRLDNQTVTDSIWIYDPRTDTSSLVLYRGQIVDLDGSPRSVIGYSFAGGNGEDGTATSFNDQGVLALRLDFPDFGGVTEGIFTAQLQPVSDVFIWDGLLDNQWWRDDGETTNWIDTAGNRHADPPGNSPEDVVLIGNAQVTLARPGGQGTLVGTITSGGTLLVETPLAIAAEASFFALTANADVTLPPATVTVSQILELNAGTLRLNGGSIELPNAARVVVRGGVLELRGGERIFSSSANGGRVDLVGGTLRKLGAGQAELAVGMFFEADENPGSRVDVAAGTLLSSAGISIFATRDGAPEQSHFQVSAGAVLDLRGTNTFDGHALVDGAGNLLLEGSLMPFLSLLNTDLTLRVSGAGAFELAGGTLGGAAPIINQGNFRWSGGTIAVGSLSNAGQPINPLTHTGAAFDIVDGSDKTLAGVLVNQGFLTQHVDATVNGAIVNEFEYDLRLGRIAGTGRFINHGTLVRRPGSDGEAIIDIAYTGLPGSTIHVQHAALVFRSASTHPAGAYQMDQAGLLEFRQGTASFTGSLTFTGLGLVKVSGEQERATLSITPGATVTSVLPNGLIIEGGRLVIDGGLTNLGVLRGEGAGEVVINGLLLNQLSALFEDQFTADSDLRVNSAGRLTNAGRLELEGSATWKVAGVLTNRQNALLTHGNDAVIHMDGQGVKLRNSGEYQLQGKVTAASFGNRFENEGILVLDRRGGVVSVGGRFGGKGSVEVKEDTTGRFAAVMSLLPVAVGTHTLEEGTWTVRNGARLELNDRNSVPRPSIGILHPDTTIILHGTGTLNNLPLASDQTDVGEFLIGGRLELRDGSQWLSGPVKLLAPVLVSDRFASLYIGPGSAMAFDYLGFNSFNSALQNGLYADIYTTVTVNGLLAPNDTSGDLHVPLGFADVFIEGRATLNGSGIVRRSVRIGGKLQPGRSPGTLTLDGDLLLGPEAIVQLEAAGTSAADVDHLIVLGNAELDGELRLAFIDGFAPQAGQVFTFFDVAGDITGAFQTTRIVGLATGFQFDAGFDDQGLFSLTAFNDGVSLPAEIRGVAFDDRNGDGVLDPGEPGRAGVTVRLRPFLPEGGEGDELLALTDPLGHYVFANLPAGNYRLRIDPPEGLFSTTATTADTEAQNGIVLVAFDGQAALPANDARLEELTFLLAFGSVAADFGDAPDPPYSTLAVHDGARHLLLEGLHLGATVSADTDGRPDEDADGDNGDDGVTFGTFLIGRATSVTVSVVLPAGVAQARLDAWIDFDGDGAWDGVGEQVVVSQAVTAGPNVFQITAPLDARLGTTFARFRLSLEGGLSPTGPAASGEVEDYAVTIAAPGPDLTLSLLSGPPATIFPGQKLTLRAQISNVGDAHFAGTTPIQVFLLPVGVQPGENDTPLLTLHKRLNLSANASKPAKVRIKVVVPTDLPAGDYDLVIVVNGQASVAERSHDNNSTSAPAALSLTFGAGGARKILFRGTTYSLAGNATGQIIPGFGDQPDSLLITSSDPRARLTLKAGKGASAAIDNITVDGSVSQITATGIRLAGDVNVSGLLGTLRLGDIAEDHRIRIAGAPGAGTLFALTAGNVQDLSIESSIPIRSLKVNQWLDSGGETDLITAPFVISVQTGGDFEADMQLTDPTAAMSLTKLSVGGRLLNAAIDAVRSIGRVTLGQMIDSRLLAGIRPGLATLPTVDSDFLDTTQPVAIRSLTVQGLRGAAEPSFVNSHVAAAVLGKIRLRAIEPSNSDEPFGLVARDSIASFSRTGAPPQKLLNVVGIFDQQEDFVLRVV